MGAYGGLKVTIFVRVSNPSQGAVFAHVRGVDTYPPQTPQMVPKGPQTLDKHALEPYRAYISVWEGLGGVGDL